MSAFLSDHKSYIAHEGSSGFPWRCRGLLRVLLKVAVCYRAVRPVASCFPDSKAEGKFQNMGRIGEDSDDGFFLTVLRYERRYRAD